MHRRCVAHLLSPCLSAFRVRYFSSLFFTAFVPGRPTSPPAAPPPPGMASPQPAALLQGALPVLTAASVVRARRPWVVGARRAARPARGTRRCCCVGWEADGGGWGRWWGGGSAVRPPHCATRCACARVRRDRRRGCFGGGRRRRLTAPCTASARGDAARVPCDLRLLLPPPPPIPFAGAERRCRCSRCVVHCDEVPVATRADRGRRQTPVAPVCAAGQVGPLFLLAPPVACASVLGWQALVCRRAGGGGSSCIQAATSIFFWGGGEPAWSVRAAACPFCPAPTESDVHAPPAVAAAASPRTPPRCTPFHPQCPTSAAVPLCGQHARPHLRLLPDHVCARCRTRVGLSHARHPLSFFQ